MNNEIELKKGDVITIYKWETALKRWKKYEEGFGIDMSDVKDILGIGKHFYDKISDKESFIVVSSNNGFYLTCNVTAPKLIFHMWSLPRCIVKKVGVNVYEKR